MANEMPKPITLRRPCPVERSAAFEERDGARFCLHCSETTHDLSEATQSEVRALMRANAGRVCARVRLWPSGEIRFRPEPPARGLAAMSAAIGLALAACDPPSASVIPEPAPPTTQPEPSIAAPPTSVVAAAPATDLGAPPTSIAPPPSTATDEIDHSTDASHNAADHTHHRHQHPATPVDEHPEYALGGLG